MEQHEMEEMAKQFAKEKCDRHGSEYWRGLQTGFLNGLQAKNISFQPPVMKSLQEIASNLESVRLDLINSNHAIDEFTPECRILKNISTKLNEMSGNVS